MYSLIRFFRIAAGVAVLAAAGAAPAAAWALGDASIVTFARTRGAFPLVRDGRSVPLLVSAQDHAGVLRATRDLQADIERVTSVRPAVETAGPENWPGAVIVGTLGRSPFIDQLVRNRKIDVGGIRGRWEAFTIQVVERPLPGVKRALVIAGSDKRGTIYGVYELSEQIGVSPWYWWADSVPAHRDTLFILPRPLVNRGPAVKYRGIFLNDEAPDLTNWVWAKYGQATPRANPPVPPGVANYGHEFYARMFEVILRLRGNYLWPAMWNNAFNEDDPENARLADEYGVVMGTSHQEPMLRAQKEWDRRYLRTIGPWNYATHPDVLENFWREGIRRNRDFESVITIGLRGANDTPMAPGGPQANRALLEKIIERQRTILGQEMNPDVAKVPQLWCLYKEVQDFYEAGLRAPDDVTLLWAEDNWGNVRRLPTAAERRRPGGAGIYYHFDYHGGPRSYQWIDTSPLPKVWEQMSLADQYGADRIWIVNVGHFKGYELPTEYFLRLAWEPQRWANENVAEFTRLWAAREFGPGHAADIAGILASYAKYNGRRKPEMLAPSTYSLTDYREAETVVVDYEAVVSKAEQISRELPPAKRDAFYELVLFPAKASCLVNELYLAAGRNALYARQGRVSANGWAAATTARFDEFVALMTYYNRTFAGGRWDHFMDQPVLGYTSWRDPPENSLKHIELAKVTAAVGALPGIAVEGSAAAWPGASGEPALPQFDAFANQQSYFEVFNRGAAPFEFTAEASAPWIILGETRGRVGPDRRVPVHIDWSKAPAGTAAGSIRIATGAATVTVRVDAFNPTQLSRTSLRGFVESRGVVSIEPEHYTKKNDVGARRWTRIDDYGRTLSGMRADGPADVAPATPGVDSPSLEYRMHLFTTGPVEVTAITAPTLNFIPNRPVRYAVSFDDGAPQEVTLVPRGYTAQNSNPSWERSVGDNAHYATSRLTVEKPGDHTLKIWMIDPAVVMQKLVVDLGGLKPCYLGPPESPRFAPR